MEMYICISNVKYTRIHPSLVLPWPVHKQKKQFTGKKGSYKPKLS